MKSDITIYLSQKEITPVIKFCASNRGAIARIHELYQKALGKPISRVNIERWLNKDPARRIQPLHGSGMLLLNVANKVMAMDRGKIDQSPGSGNA